MAMIEQNISGVKLERMRQKANHKTKVMFTLPKVIFILSVILTLIQNRYFFILLFEGYEMGWDSIVGGIFMIIGGIMISFCMAALVFAFYMLIVWKKAYNLFNDNYKNKYVLLKMQEVPGFSQLKYSPGKGLTFEETVNRNLLPGRTKSLFQSEDYFEGIYDGICFRSSSVETQDSSRSSVSLFSGQVIIFSMFHEFKISAAPLQIFSKKEYTKMKDFTLPIRIETENEVFNNLFSVFAEDEHNAFYILTPQVMEDMMEFAQIVKNDIYFIFADQYMYVGCEQMRNPFNAIVDMPIEEQSQNIVKAIDVIQKAKNILIHMEEQ